MSAQCQKCKSERIAEVNAKCSDRCHVYIEGKESYGYVPSDMGIGGNDYVEIDLCLNCGHVNGRWPLEKCELEMDDDESV